MVWGPTIAVTRQCVGLITILVSGEAVVLSDEVELACPHPEADIRVIAIKSKLPRDQKRLSGNSVTRNQLQFVHP